MPSPSLAPSRLPSLSTRSPSKVSVAVAPLKLGPLDSLQEATKSLPSPGEGEGRDGREGSFVETHLHSPHAADAADAADARTGRN